MSSEGSDSEGAVRESQPAASPDSGSRSNLLSPNRTDQKGPRTPGSPVSNSNSLSPRGPRSPPSPREPRSPPSPREPRSPPSPRGPRSPPSPRESRSRSNSPNKSRNSKSRSPGSPQSKSRSPVSRRSKSRSPASNSSRSVSPAPKRGPRSPPPENFDDDGRSNISSGSSILSLGSPASPKVNGATKTSPAKVPFSVPNAEDLSDVSDIGEGDDLGSPKDRSPKPKSGRNARTSRESDDDGEVLDFEVEDQPDGEKEEGERESKEHQPSAEKKSEKPEKTPKEDGEDKSGDDGECKDDEGAESLEEGEVSDDGDPKPEKPPICRFYSRGACTWGNNCRFLHPGVTDKGNYSMFESSRPVVAGNGIGLYPAEPRPYPMLIPSRVLPGPYGPIVRREDPAAAESAWERGLRQAKELMRISTKRKESDMDFEEKKMNMSIGQDEMDKENDYYTRVASPVETDPYHARLSPRRDEPEVRRPVRVVERYEDIVANPLSPSYERYDHRRPRDPEYVMRREKYYGEDEPRKSKKMVREVIVQRGKARSPDARKPDEWQDPWMRARSPGGKHRSRKVSYSSGSSSYSGSSSRSSSNSSYSSYSRSRSRSGSRSPARARRPRSPPPTGIPVRPKGLEGKFKPMKIVAPEKPTIERPLLMNPPAPSPLRTKRPISPNTAIKKVGLNPPAPTPKPKSQAKTKTKKSRSSSSGSSSSDSSHSSYSSSSSVSSKHKSPPRSKKGDAEERLKSKALKAAKAKADKMAPTATIAGKKRPADDSKPAAKDGSPAKTAPTKKSSSRREELLKQLKAVEDAIAKKRSKI